MLTIIVTFTILTSLQGQLRSTTLTDVHSNETTLQWSIEQLKQTMQNVEQLKGDLHLLRKDLDGLKNGDDKGDQAKLINKVFIENSTVVKQSSSSKASPSEMQNRLDFIKDMTRSAWNAYLKYSWGNDSLSPVSRRSDPVYNSFGPHSGRSILASLSTLWVMNLEVEFNQSSNWIQSKTNFGELEGDPKLFDVSVEYMGSLLSSYALTGNEMYLNKSKQINTKLAAAYRTNTGIPVRNYHVKSPSKSAISSLSDIGGQYLEQVYLSHLLGDETIKYDVMHLRDYLRLVDKPNKGTLYYTHLNYSGKWKSSTSSLFSSSSQFYFNLLKSYIQSNGKNTEALKMYSSAIEAMDDVGMFATGENGTVWARDYSNNGTYGSVMEYSGCYLGAMLALGVNVLKQSTAQMSRYQQLAINLTETCYQASTQTQTKLGPSAFNPEEKLKGDGGYSLSAELAESYFILWRLTGDTKYRDYAWEMAQAIRRYCSTASGGFSALANVNDLLSAADHQPAIFLSATLKYLYLTFTDVNVYPLDRWIFNSVGHPLPICGKHLNYPIESCNYPSEI